MPFLLQKDFRGYIMLKCDYVTEILTLLLYRNIHNSHVTNNYF